MSVISFPQIYFLFSTVGFAFINEATSCQVYPSEYAYHYDSVTRVESASANCRRYPIISGLPAGIDSIDYIHCIGTQLKLADSNLGSEQPFSSSSHYQWSAGSDGQLLFIFPTRISLTTITLHYYSDSIRGLPRLRFYAVRDDFDIWDAPTRSTPHVDVTSVLPGGEPAGRRNVSINVNFNTSKVLMYKFSSTFTFAVSEVEFFICTPTTIIATTMYITTSQQTLLTTTTSTSLANPPMATAEGSLESTEDEPHSTPLSSNKQIQCHVINPREIVAWVLVVILVVLLIVLLTINVMIILWAYKRSRKTDDPSPDCAVAMDSNPCYEASNVKQTEAQEAVHVYEMVKQRN